jgi:anti-sigma regulatory factor (Ser/Thr protein kinase)
MSLPADERLLRATRRAVAAYLEEFVASADIIDDVVLALNEACTNVLQHAFSKVGSGTLCLRADLTTDEVVVEVVDDGIGFDVMRYQAGDLLAVFGRGLEMVRRLMTTVEVESPRPDGGTRLLMKKTLGQKAPGD